MLLLLLIIFGTLTLALAAVLYNNLKIHGPVDAVPLTISPPILHQLIQAKPIVSSPLPVRLKIPNAGVDAALDYVSLVSGGAMGVPKGRLNAAWFQLGPRPGEIGSAVIDGHFGWSHSLSAVFDNLYKLHKGDTMTVEDDKGVAITFVVTELRIYDQSQDATDVFHSTDGKAHLNLITCEGVWSVAQQRFPSRLVVFSDKASP